MIFLAIRLVDKLNKKPEVEVEAAAAPAEDIVLLEEIRDLLKANKN